MSDLPAQYSKARAIFDNANDTFRNTVARLVPVGSIVSVPVGNNRIECEVTGYWSSNHYIGTIELKNTKSGARHSKGIHGMEIIHKAKPAKNRLTEL